MAESSLNERYRNAPLSILLNSSRQNRVVLVTEHQGEGLSFNSEWNRA